MFTWMGTASQIGSALGSLLSGYASDWFPPHLAVGFAGIFIVIAALIAFAMRVSSKRITPVPRKQ